MRDNRTKNNYCKIVATLGSTEGREDIIEKLFLAGADVFRLNLSHDSVAGHSKKVDIIRGLEKKYKKPIGVIFDLQGPKLRVGKFKDNQIILKKGQSFQLDLDEKLGDETRVNLPHPEIYSAAAPGNILLFNDGLIRVKIENITKDSIQTTVLNGGILSNHKGVNVPDVALPISALTERDMENIKQANQLEVDWFALSFVQKPEDIMLARSLIKPSAGIIAKIEKPQAIESLDKIIELSDVIMVARGDLGVELSSERVPVLQRKIVSACRKVGKPVIVATQMLESMVSNVNPTRAEASDVATAVYEGADAVMLSAETAVGAYPEEAVSTMDRIIANVEQEEDFIRHMRSSVYEPHIVELSNAITKAACQAATNIENADIIVTFTDTGFTTLKAARHRPYIPIFSLTPSKEVARRMSVVWGAQAYLVGGLSKFEDIEKEVRNVLEPLGLLSEGRKVVVVAGIPFGQSGETNLMYVITL